MKSKILLSDGMTIVANNSLEDLFEYALSLYLRVNTALIRKSSQKFIKNGKWIESISQKERIDFSTSLICAFGNTLFFYEESRFGLVYFNNFICKTSEKFYFIREDTLYMDIDGNDFPISFGEELDLYKTARSHALIGDMVESVSGIDIFNVKINPTEKTIEVLSSSGSHIGAWAEVGKKVSIKDFIINNGGCYEEF